MRNIKITYWISTCIISALVFFSGYNYLTREEVTQACQHLGFPIISELSSPSLNFQLRLRC